MHPADIVKNLLKRKPRREETTATKLDWVIDALEHLLVAEVERLCAKYNANIK